MSALDTLARVARGQAEEIERELAAAQARQEAIRSRIAAHDRAVEGEGALARGSPEAAMAFGAFAQHALAQRKMMETEHAALAQEADALRETLREAFIELKKIETLIGNEAERAAAEADRREQAQMDDIAANMRRGADNGAGR